MGFLNSLGASLTSNASNLLVYIAIVVTFVLGVVLCVMPVMRNRRLLKRGVRLIRQGTKARRNWQQEDFLGSGSLMPHWSAYLNNLFFAEGEYHNASNVEDFINEETTINGPGRSALAEAVPSLLVSLGFLGTLIGLAQGLSGFDMTDSTTAQQSIMVLIPGMKYAFMTSIFGVIGSILFTMLTRAVYGSTENALKRFYADAPLRIVVHVGHAKAQRLQHPFSVQHGVVLDARHDHASAGPFALQHAFLLLGQGKPLIDLV